MTGAADEIRRELEAAFDIPFFVQEQTDHGEPSYLAGPSNDEDALFDIRVSFSNHMRLIMEFLPQRYSAHFVNAMGRRCQEARCLFSQYAGRLIASGARIAFRVNGEIMQPDSPLMWPDDWHDISIRVTKSPIADSDNFSYPAVARVWLNIMMGMVLSLANIVPTDEQPATEGYAEGHRYTVASNRYERNPLNRNLCLEIKGYCCTICNMDFEMRYGEIGHNFIHVHHITPVSMLGETYVINPMTDLIPVCPNCHAMLHRCDPPMKPEELKKILSMRPV